MPSNFLIVGTAGANVEFGTDDVGYSAIGTIVDADREDTGDELELKDRGGNVVVVIFFNDKKECTVNVIFDSDADIPARGDAIDVCGVEKALVRAVKHKWANDKERMLSIVAVRNVWLASS